MREVGPATTSFLVRALRNGSIVMVAWSEGAFEGDPPTLDLIGIEAEMIVTSRTDPLLGFIGEGDIQVASLEEAFRDPVVAFALVDRVVDRILEVALDPIKEPN